jgi:hypothetical protein
MRSLGLFGKRRNAAWRAADSEAALRRFAKDRDAPLDSIDAAALVPLMSSWFDLERPADALGLDEDGDGLLFEWGTFDFGARRFQYGISRQITTAEDDDSEMWQLHVTLHYPADADTAALGQGNHWCFQPSALPAFEQAVAESAATSYARNHRPDRVEITLEQV